MLLFLPQVLRHLTKWHRLRLVNWLGFRIDSALWGVELGPNFVQLFSLLLVALQFGLHIIDPTVSDRVVWKRILLFCSSVIKLVFLSRLNRISPSLLLLLGLRLLIVFWTTLLDRILRSVIGVCWSGVLSQLEALLNSLISLSLGWSLLLDLIILLIFVGDWYLISKISVVKLLLEWLL